MTNSYNLSPSHPKLVLIHGLNNNAECFGALERSLTALGFSVTLVTLPGHGSNREEGKDFKKAFQSFEHTMKKLGPDPFVAVAFSHGALYLQLWIEKDPARGPKAQVLLAPALYIYHQKIAEKIMTRLPPFLLIKSFSPKKFRRYSGLRPPEYVTLLTGMTIFQKIQSGLKVPTILFIDPKDELVDASKLKEEIEKKNPTVKVNYLIRDYLKGLGSHHILFDPAYFREEEWSQLMNQIETFLKDKIKSEA